MWEGLSIYTSCFTYYKANCPDLISKVCAQKTTLYSLHLEHTPNSPNQNPYITPGSQSGARALLQDISYVISACFQQINPKHEIPLPMKCHAFSTTPSMCCPFCYICNSRIHKQFVQEIHRFKTMHACREQGPFVA